MKNLQLIALAGKRGSGKGRVIDILQYQCGYHHADVQVVNFADALKTVCATLEHPAAPDEVLPHYYEQKGKAEPSGVFGLTRGALLQEVGEALRRWQPEVWKEVAMTHIFALQHGMKGGEIVVVGDVRYRNEAEAIKRAGGVVIRLEGDPLGQRGDGTRDDNHESEVALDNYNGFDVVIYNGGTPEQLAAGVRQVLSQLQLGQRGQYSHVCSTGNSRWTPCHYPLPYARPGAVLPANYRQ